MLSGISGAFSYPSGINVYSNLTLNSTWTSNKGYVQQLVNISESTFSGYIKYNTNFANFEYFYTSNGTVIPSWIESNTSGKLITWLKIKNTTAATNGIALGFFNTSINALSSIGTNGIGEAPQLPSTYAKYDDGRKVFNFYDNFNGTTLNSTLWSESLNGGGVSINDGLNLSQVSGTQNFAFIYSKSTGYPSILESLVTQSSEATVNTAWAIWYDSESTPTSLGPTGYGAENFQDLGGTPQLRIRISTASSVGSPSITGIMGLTWNTSDLQYLYFNYTKEVTSTYTAHTWASNYSIVIAQEEGYGWAEYKWIRTRTYPAINYMPSITFGATKSTGSTSTVSISISPHPKVLAGNLVTVTATCNLGATCEVQSPLGTTLASGTTTATYSSSTLNLGWHNFYAVNVNGSIHTNETVDNVLYYVLNNATLSSTIYETENEHFNYTFNISKDVLSANLIIDNGTTYIASNVLSMQSGQTAYNFSTLYNVKLTQLNDSKHNYNATLNLSLTNSTNVLETKFNNNTQYTLWNYIPTLTSKYLNITTRSSQTIYANITQKKSISLASANIILKLNSSVVPLQVFETYYYYTLINPFKPSTYKITNPIGTNKTDINSSLTVNLIYNNVKVFRNISISPLFTDYNPYLLTCNATLSKAFIWTYYNASNLQPITENILMQGHYIIIPTNTTIQGINAGFTTTSTANTYSTCIYPKWATFYVNGAFKYGGTNYSTTNFLLVNQSASARTTSLKLYLQQITNASSYDIVVENGTNNFIAADVQEFYYNINSNVSVPVDEFQTSTVGGYVTNLQYNERYSFSVYSLSGKLLTTTGLIQATCGSGTTCIYYINVANTSSTSPTGIINNIEYSCNVSNDTITNASTVSCSVKSILNQNITATLQVSKNFGVSSCNKNVSAPSMVLTCTANNTNSTQYLWVLTYKGIPNIVLDQGSLGKSATLFGQDGYLFTLIIILGLTLLGATISPQMVVIFGAIGMLLSSYIALINNTSIGLGFLIAFAAIIVYVLRQRF